MQLLICNVNVIRRGWYSWLHLLRYDWVCEINNVKLHTRRPSLAWCAWAHQVQTVYDDAPMSGRHCSTVSGGTLVTSLWDRTTTASSFGCQPYQLTVPPHRRTIYGGRAFAVAGQSTWNSLPKRLRDPSSSSAVFARLLKAFLFSSNVSKRIRGFGDDALYKSTFYITFCFFPAVKNNLEQLQWYVVSCGVLQFIYETCIDVNFVIKVGGSWRALSARL